jgi:hypothetical protein
MYAPLMVRASRDATAPPAVVEQQPLITSRTTPYMHVLQCWMAYMHVLQCWMAGLTLSG